METWIVFVIMMVPCLALMGACHWLYDYNRRLVESHNIMREVIVRIINDEATDLDRLTLYLWLDREQVEDTLSKKRVEEGS